MNNITISNGYSFPKPNIHNVVIYNKILNIYNKMDTIDDKNSLISCIIKSKSLVSGKRSDAHDCELCRLVGKTLKKNNVEQKAEIYAILNQSLRIINDTVPGEKLGFKSFFRGDYVTCIR